MRRRRTPRPVRNLLKIVLIVIIATVLIVIFLPESRISRSLRVHFEKWWPDWLRTVHHEPGGEITVLFAPSAPEDENGIDDSLIRLIKSADEEIKIAIYDLALENVTDALIKADKAGADVYLIYDPSNKPRAETQMIKKCERGGIKIASRPKGSGIMHNKFLIIDREKVWTGSMNFTPNGAYENNNNCLIIKSKKIAADYSAEFDEMYDGSFGASSPANTAYPNVILDGHKVEIYFAPEDRVEEEILSEIRAAKEEIAFMAFSFTSKPIAELMAEKMDKGVRVRGVFERTQRSRYSRFDFLQKAGADLRWDTNRHSMHHKVIIIDRSTVITGSYNFSKSANTKNDENCLIIHSDEIAQAYLKEFKRVWK